MSLIPARIKSLEEASGMVTLAGNQEIVSQMRAAWVSQIQTRKQRYDSSAGPMYQPLLALGNQVV
jgi:beta-xylosidase